MTTKVTATTLKTHVLSLLDDVERGEEIEVTRHGRIIARIVPVRDFLGLKDMFAGVVKSPEDEKQFSLDDEWTYDADNTAR
jgi:prevent-host-death family protein